MTTRRIHGAQWHVDVVVDRSSTAGDVIQKVQAALPDQPWNGNVLLSCGPLKFRATDVLEDVAKGGGDLFLSNFSALTRPGRVRIATEKSGITILQIQQLLDFVHRVVGTLCDSDRAARGFWAETYGADAGRPLSFESFNLYNANDWVIHPATAQVDGLGCCSYVELVAETPEMQYPIWFVSHAWLEPILLFLSCLRRHAALRELESAAYWVCAYANNQHLLEDAICENPRKTSFYLAMRLCTGVVLVLDSKATPFTRIWCCFEESIAVELKSRSFLLDVAVTDACNVAHVVTDGLAGAESRVLPILGLLCKSRREQSFPMDLLRKGLGVDIATAQASKAEDVTRILNSIAFPRSQTQALNSVVPQRHPKFDFVNRSLAGHFALSSIVAAYWQGCDPGDLLRALQSDEERNQVRLSFTGCQAFQDQDLTSLVNHLPSGLRNLRLDLGFTGLQDFAAPALNCQNLKTVILHFTGGLQQVSGLPHLLVPSLRHLELWFLNLPLLQDIELGSKNEAIQKLHLEYFVLYVNGCPAVPQSSKKALRVAARKLQWRQGRDADMWIHIEDTGWSWPRITSFACGAKRMEVCSSQSCSQTGHTCAATDFDAATEAAKVPFPCNCCANFHSNADGYCDSHRFFRFSRSFFSSCYLALQIFELLLIFFVQAAADIESRGLLALIVISLYPVVCMGLAEAVGISATSICVASVSVVFASVSYAVLRFDQMQRATLELALTSEAICSEVLQPENLPYLSLVFGRSAEEYPSITDVRQNVADLRDNFVQAKMHFQRFQNALCQALSEDGPGLDVVVKIKRLSELKGAHDCDVLYCEISCDSLVQVQEVWKALSGRFQSEEVPVRIAALWDGFAQEEQRCSKIILSLDGYLATVVLLVASLTTLERDLSSLCRLADSFGLLEDSKPRRELTEDDQKLVTPLPLRITTAVARFSAMLVAAYFMMQYFLRHRPSQVVKHLPAHLQGFLSLKGTEPSTDDTCWKALALAGPYAVLVAVFAFHLLAKNCSFAVGKRRRRRLSQLLYERYFGVRGLFFDLKVAGLQAVTVMLQAFGKLHLLGGITLFAIQQESEVVMPLKVSFWTFFGLLALNSLYPSVLSFSSQKVWCRYASASMDVVLDLGYVVTYLSMVLIGMTELHAEVTVSGNFGDRTQLGFQNRIDPSFAFPSELLQYLAVYMSVAHICCATSSLERAARQTQHQPPSNWSDFRLLRLARFGLKYIYTPCLMGLLISLVASRDFYPGHTGNFSCFPCWCSKGHLQSCGLAARLQQQQLVIGGVHSFEARAFEPLGCRLSQLSLANNSLGKLGSRSFEHLPCLRVLDLGHAKLQSLDKEAFFGLGQLEVLSMHGNEISEISPDHFSHLPSLEQLLLGSRAVYDEEADRVYEPEVGNLIQVLPPRLFAANRRLRYLDLSGNRIRELHEETFAGAQGLQLLDLSFNQLRRLPAKAFPELRGLRVLALHGNRLRALPATIFAGLHGLQKLVLNDNNISELPETIFAELSELQELWLYDNNLTELPETIFAKLSELQKLYLYNNNLRELPSAIFAGLRGLKILSLSNNNLSELPETIFAGLRGLKKLSLSKNSLSELPKSIFSELRGLQELWLRRNNLSELPPAVFAQLHGLQRLYVDGNVLTELPEAIFAQLRGLQRLDLSSNSLSALPSAIFRELRGLQKLWLFSNNLTELPEAVFAELSELQELWLYSNRLRRLPAAIFAGLHALKKLSLFNNSLSELPEAIFAGLSGLQELYLYDNSLRELPSAIFAGLRALQVMDLYSNNLRELPVAIFAGLHGLQQLWLDKNSFTELPETVFTDLHALQMLDLSSNHLSALPATIFSELRGLKELDLSHNNLSALPEDIFAGPSGLQVLDLSGNELSAFPQRLVSELFDLQALRWQNTTQATQEPGS